MLETSIAGCRSLQGDFVKTEGENLFSSFHATTSCGVQVVAFGRGLLPSAGGVNAYTDTSLCPQAVV